jgi:uncharacterized protein (DUF433 family)
MVESSNLIGIGIYTVPDAARLSRVSSRRIRYWLQRAPSETSASRNRRLWTGQHQPIDHKIVLGFLDLQEVRFVDAFLNAGVSWRVVRDAHEVAKIRYSTEHPFCTRQFATDGKHIIEQIQNDTHLELEEVVFGQKVFPKVVAPFLRDLKFAADGQIAEWWPLGTRRRVVLDPTRQFGQPIVSKSGIRTEILYLATRNGASGEDVADWFEVDQEDVRDAVEFERLLAA